MPISGNCLRRSASWFFYFCASLALVPNTAAQAPSSSSPAESAAFNYSPTNPSATKSYDDALNLLEKGHAASALEAFCKADKLDGGHCFMCELEGWDAAMQAKDFKGAEEQATTMLANVTAPAMKAKAELMLGKAWLADGLKESLNKDFVAAEAAFQAGLQFKPDYPDCIYEDGKAQAYLNHDDLALARFQSFLKLAGPNDLNYARVQRFIAQPDMARAPLAPNFRVTTLDGKTITLESLAGKVVLLDFWAIWCPPCHRALPHLQKMAEEFDGQPFVLLSISLDPDEGKWREFTAKNHMTWPQYRDGGYSGEISRLYGVQGIPTTAIIDADGVLQDEFVGSEEVEVKLKKLVALAAEAQNHASTPTGLGKDSGTAAVPH
jgi:thiol-disulfide isomerase/thioredoxin